ncbi:hypothetical protein CEXT_153671, partial [Caerostris extrusa]
MESEEMLSYESKFREINLDLLLLVLPFQIQISNADDSPQSPYEILLEAKQE